jgi:hypothetical protein
MSRASNFLLAFVVAGLLAPRVASAQFPFTEQAVPWSDEGPPGPQEDLRFVGTNGTSGFDTQVGPYSAQMTSYPGNPFITIYCVDYLGDIQPNQQWTANVSSLSSDISLTKLGVLGASDALARYRKAAWLASQFAYNQDVGSWRQLSSALWTTVQNGDDPSMPYYGGYGDWLNRAAAAEAGGYEGFDFREWAVLTDVRVAENGLPLDPYMTQEFITRVTVTPEPETVIMLMSGLLLLGLVWRRGMFG